MAIPSAEIKVPNMPVDVFLQEASDLMEWSKEDQSQLIGVGVPQAVFGSMEQRIGALRHAQSLWNKDRYTKEEARQEWDMKSPAAYELKDQLEHDFRFAFRRRPDLLNKVKAIEEGTGHADMVQDLNDLTELGRANLHLLRAISFEEKKLHTAEVQASDLSVLLAKANGEKLSDSDSKINRDRAYTYLKSATDEIREAGKYVFWKDEVRKRGYFSRYLNKK